MVPDMVRLIHHHRLRRRRLALSTGTKTKNGMLGMSPDTIPATSVATVLHNEGWGVGITTSVAADDATPEHSTPMCPTAR